MLSIDKMSGGQVGYYLDLARTDYYLEGGEPPGRWQGGAAEKLALFGEVEDRHLREVFSGQIDGQSLVQNAGSLQRTPGWDCTFSAPKTVSVAWSQADRETGDAIRAAHNAAVADAIGFLETETGRTRRGRGGEELEACPLLVATYEHGTSRAGEPQLHTHALVMNVTVRADGTTGSLDTRLLYDHIMAGGAVYQVELARQLRQRLGVELEAHRVNFGIKGVSPKLTEHYSTRRAEIEAELERTGERGGKAAEAATLRTRGTKGHESREVLGQRWREVGREMGFTTEQVRDLCHRQHQEPTPRQQRWLADAAVTKAIKELTRTQTTFTKAHLVQKAAQDLFEQPVGAAVLLAAVENELGQGQHVQWVEHRELHDRYTTPEVLRAEGRLLGRASHLAEATMGRRVLSHFNVKPSAWSKLTDEQAAAAKHVTGSERLAVVEGDAGTGKTFMLGVARRVWERRGHKVVGTALSAKAADQLKEGAGIDEVRTIMGLLRRCAWEDEAREKGWKIKPVLDEDTVLVVDEAGMVGTRQLAELTTRVSDAGGKLVLVGDAKQLQAIDFGGGFAAVAEQAGSFRMSQVMRQADREHAEAIRSFAEGNAHAGLAYYAKQKLLSVAETRRDAALGMCEAWAEQGGVQCPQNHLMLAGRRADVAMLNREAQHRRREARELEGDGVKVSETVRIYRGERILFTENDRTLAVSNGQFARVTAINRTTKTTTVQLEGQKGRSGRRRIAFGDMSGVQLGYAVTTHKAQGMTTDRAYVLTDETMQDRELSYVQLSRAREQTRLFTTDEEAGPELSKLARRIDRSRREETATAGVARQLHRERVETELRREQTLRQEQRP